jgi:hypothetical protein
MKLDIAMLARLLLMAAKKRKCVFGTGVLRYNRAGLFLYKRGKTCREIISIQA